MTAERRARPWAEDRELVVDDRPRLPDLQPSPLSLELALRRGEAEATETYRILNDSGQFQKGRPG